MTAPSTLITQRPWLLTLLASAVSVIASDPASASRGQLTMDMSEREIARCIREASSGKPWLEKTLWGLRDQERGWIGAEIPNKDGSHDLGPLQVNSQWVSKLAALTGRSTASVRWWLTNNACFNVNAARWIFLSGLSVTRDYWKAIGVYHSPTPWRQRLYVDSVAAHLRRRFGHEVFDQ